MIRALEQEEESYKSKLFHFKEMHAKVERQTRSLVEENGGDKNSMAVDNRVPSRSFGSSLVSPNDRQIGSKLDGFEDTSSNNPKSRFGKEGFPLARDRKCSEVEQMKERFARLLLGEDMSGGGKGVSSALALSNAITNLAASVFGEHSRLEPMSAERKGRWRREIEWLLSVTDHIVEFVPIQQISKDGATMEVMTTRQRTDLHINIPALRKLDAMLIDCLENFKDQNEFHYGTKDADESEKGRNMRKDDRWWLPTPRVPPNGLPEVSRKWLRFQKDSVNQVLKAAMAINAQVLSEMEIPENYIESLPKNGKASLGDSIYKSITVEYSDPSQFLASMDLSSEHKILDLKNKIEASIVIWRRKMINKDSKSSWGSGVSLEKRELFEDRAETILLLLKQRYPGIAQSSLDISKIQFNRDVGQAILESYSRILESLAHTVMSRIEDVLYADWQVRNPFLSGQTRGNLNLSPLKSPNHRDEIDKLNCKGTPSSMTLSDFIGWNFDHGESEHESAGSLDGTRKGDGEMAKHANIVITKKRVSYIEQLENFGGLRSPTSRH